MDKARMIQGNKKELGGTEKAVIIWTYLGHIINKVYARTKQRKKSLSPSQIRFSLN